MAPKDTHATTLPDYARSWKNREFVNKGVFRTLTLPFIHCICLLLTILFRDPVHWSSCVSILPHLILSAAFILPTHPISCGRTWEYTGLDCSSEVENWSPFTYVFLGLHRGVCVWNLNMDALSWPHTLHSPCPLHSWDPTQAVPMHVHPLPCFLQCPPWVLPTCTR